jgi:AcrR family transcriptional regulator
VAVSASERAETERGSKRDAILDAALGLFAERGFHGTAVPLIAERAGVGAGTVYRYFASKEAIVNALYQTYKQRLGGLILIGIHDGQSPREQFHVYWTRMAKFALSNPAAFQFLELHHHSPYLDSTSRAMEEKLLSMALEKFAEFRRARIVRDVDPAILMALVHGAFVGLIKASNDHGLTLTPVAIAEAEQCMWEALRA